MIWSLPCKSGNGESFCEQMGFDRFLLLLFWGYVFVVVVIVVVFNGRDNCRCFVVVVV